MITQKPISLKINVELLKKLDEELSHDWKSRNACINEAISVWLELRDAKRHERYANSVGENACKESLLFIKKHLVHDVQFFLDKKVEDDDLAPGWITQKPISLNIYVDLLKKLDENTSHDCKMRNARINEAIRVWFELKDAVRHERYANSVGEYACKESLMFIKKYLVHNVQFFLDKIVHH